MMMIVMMMMVISFVFQSMVLLFEQGSRGVMFRIYLTNGADLCWRWMWSVSLVWRTGMYLEKFLPHEILMLCVCMVFFPSESYSASRLQVFLLFRLAGIFKTLVGLKLRLIFKKHAGFSNLLLCSLPYELQSGVKATKLVSLRNFMVNKNMLGYKWS